MSLTGSGNSGTHCEMYKSRAMTAHTSFTSRSRFKTNTVCIRRSWCSSCIAFSRSLCSSALQTAYAVRRMQSRTVNKNFSILDFIAAKNGGVSGKTCKAPAKLSPPTNQHPAFFIGRLPFCRPTNSVRALKEKSITFHGLAHPKLTSSW